MNNSWIGKTRKLGGRIVCARCGHGYLTLTKVGDEYLHATTDMCKYAELIDKQLEEAWIKKDTTS